MKKLQRLKELINSKILLSENIFVIDDIELILDYRDEADFDGEWIRNYNAIDEKKDLIDLESKELIEEIREVSFKAVYDAAQSGELAAYVSDDFGLMAEALVVNYNDEWLNALGKTYVEGKIPYGNLKAIKGELSKILLY